MNPRSPVRPRSLRPIVTTTVSRTSRRRPGNGHRLRTPAFVYAGPIIASPSSNRYDHRRVRTSPRRPGNGHRLRTRRLSDGGRTEREDPFVNYHRGRAPSPRRRSVAFVRSPVARASIVVIAFVRSPVARAGIVSPPPLRRALAFASPVPRCWHRHCDRV